MEARKPRRDGEGAGALMLHPSARPMLTDTVQPALDGLLSILERAAEDKSVLVTKVEVSGFVDPDEDSQEIVVTQWVGLPSKAALDYWDSLGGVIEGWIETLPEEMVGAADEQLAVEVRSAVDDSTVRSA